MRKYFIKSVFLLIKRARQIKIPLIVELSLYNYMIISFVKVCYMTAMNN